MGKSRKKAKKGKKKGATHRVAGFGEVDASGRAGQYRKPSTVFKTDSLNFWHPAPNQNLAQDSVIHFQMTTRADQVIRFPTDCFNLTYRAQHDNSDYLSTATADTGGKDLTTKEHFTMPITKDPRVYLEPALGGVSFFERVEVSVNGMPVKAHEFGPFHYVYQTLNRTFTTRGNRDKKYGGDIARTHTGLDRAPGTSNTVTEVPKDKRELREAMKTLQHDAVKTSADLESRFTFDGVWPFDSQSNLLLSTSKERKEEGWLPPGIVLNVALYKREPLTALVQDATCLDTVYYSDTINATDAKNEVRVTLVDLTISYEVGSLENKAKMDAMRRGTEYFVDVPTVTVQRLDAGAAATSNAVQVPAHTKLVANAFMHTYQLYYNSVQKKMLAPRFHFPPGATRLKVGFPGDPPLFFNPEGFVNPGTTDAHASPTSVWYQKYLVKRGLYDHGKEDMFPKSGVKSDDQVILSELTHLGEPQKNTELLLDCTFDSDLSPEKWLLLTVALRQFKFTYHDGQPVTFKPI